MKLLIRLRNDLTVEASRGKVVNWGVQVVIEDFSGLLSDCLANVVIVGSNSRLVTCISWDHCGFLLSGSLLLIKCLP